MFTYALHCFTLTTFFLSVNHPCFKYGFLHGSRSACLQVLLERSAEQQSHEVKSYCNIVVLTFSLPQALSLPADVEYKNDDFEFSCMHSAVSCVVSRLRRFVHTDDYIVFSWNKHKQNPDTNKMKNK